MEKQRLSVSDAATMYACCGLFDLCTDRDLMSLSFEGQQPFLDWLGWQASNQCIERKSFISWVRPEECAEAYLGDPCADPVQGEFGTCDFLLEDFGRLRATSPVRDITFNDVQYCAAQPRYRLDGSLIEDVREWDVRVATEILIQSLQRLVVTGNAATGGQFDGLLRLHRTNYVDPTGHPCHMMDSIVIDWNQNDMGGGAGITWNGAAVGDGFDLVDVLLAAWRQVKRRISWSPALASRAWSPGNTVLVMPGFLAHCLLDHYTCWSVCPDSTILTYEGRQFRETLNGGLFGFGQISLDGDTIPVVAYDWGLIDGPTRGTIMMLTNELGGMRLINGQYLDMRAPGASGYPGARQKFEYLDGGRLLTWSESDETCIHQRVEMRPRILSWAPWAQIRIEDVRCGGPGPVISPDPCDTSFYPETSFSAAECAEDEEEGEQPE
jgi:hypothetical protein